MKNDGRASAASKPPPLNFGDLALREFGAQHYMRLWKALTLTPPDAALYEGFADMLKAGKRGISLKKRAAGFNWKWLQEVTDLDAHDAPKHQPVLRVPFSGAELAAHLLDGIGAILAGAYGGLDGPEPDVTRLGVTKTREGEDVWAHRMLWREVTVLRRAWQAYNLALTVVGPKPASVDQFVAGLPDHAKPTQDELKAIDASYRAAYPTWLRNMVTALTAEVAGHPLTAAPSPRLASGGVPLQTDGGKDLWQEERSRAARAAANARHGPTRDAKRLVLEFWNQHRGTMNKEQAATAMADMKPPLVSESRSTIRNWLKGA